MSEQKPAKKRAPKRVPVYIATGTFYYRFICDGTRIYLQEGVAPQGLTEAQLRELKKYKRVREVK